MNTNLKSAFFDQATDTWRGADGVSTATKEEMENEFIRRANLIMTNKKTEVIYLFIASGIPIEGHLSSEDINSLFMNGLAKKNMILIEGIAKMMRENTF